MPFSYIHIILCNPLIGVKFRPAFIKFAVNVRGTMFVVTPSTELAIVSCHFHFVCTRGRHCVVWRCIFIGSCVSLDPNSPIFITLLIVTTRTPRSVIVSLFLIMVISKV